MKRRTFIKQAALSSAVAAIPFALKAAPLKKAIHPVGIQLFTLMKPLDEDLTGTLKKVAALGYREIESAFSMKGGYYGMKPKEFATLVKDLGLSWKSHHVLGAPFVPPPDVKLPPAFSTMKTLKDSHQQLVDDAAEGGVQYLVCANTPIKTSQEVKESLEVLIKTGEACKKANITFAYHNHDAEFKAVEGTLPYDTFLTQASSDILKMELDLAWVTKAGVDPIALFEKYPGRFPLWHVKDFDKTFTNILPVGQGVVDFKKIFANAHKAGMKHFFVEHDMPEKPFDSITASIKYINEVLQPVLK
jgi:sugar phosphate isomerase/epimerase